VLAGISIFLVRRFLRAREDAEAQLRIITSIWRPPSTSAPPISARPTTKSQRFAYIVSHDLRSPLVNIMGFTSELEELRGDIFKADRSARLRRHFGFAAAMVAGGIEPVLDGEDKQLRRILPRRSDSSNRRSPKMDRADISDPPPHPRGAARVRAGADRDSRTDRRYCCDRRASGCRGRGPDSRRNRCRPSSAIASRCEQIFSNLIDNALKYLKPGVPGDISVRGRTKLGFAIFEIADNGRGVDPKDHQRIFDLFRRAGTQDRPGQGIGLAHVRTLVRRLGGTMSVHRNFTAAAHSR